MPENYRRQSKNRTKDGEGVWEWKYNITSQKFEVAEFLITVATYHRKDSETKSDSDNHLDHLHHIQILKIRISNALASSPSIIEDFQE